MSPWSRTPKPDPLPLDECSELLALLRDIAPKVKALDEVFKEWPDAWGVLDEIVAQFRTNSGHSLRDAVNRVDLASKKLAVVADDMARMLSKVDAATTLSAASGLRLEGAAEDAAQLVRGVADDLERSHEQADNAGKEHGAGADAFARTTQPTEDASITPSSGEEPSERP